MNTGHSNPNTNPGATSAPQTRKGMVPGPHLPWTVLAWVAIGAIFGALLWLLSPMLLPFAVALVLAYFLDPVATTVMRLGIGRTLASLIVALVCFGSLLAIVLVGVPLIISEASALLDLLPEDWDTAEERADDLLPDAVADQLGGEEGLAATAIENLRGGLSDLAARMAGGVSGIISVVMFWVVMPVVTVYLLVDWQRLIAAADDLLPRPQAPALREIARDIDRTLSGYIRGQSMVCGILIAYYSTALTLVGLPFGFAVGALTGAVSFIPYIGMFIGTSLGVGVAIWQFWGDPLWIGAVAGIYALGLFVESEILVPRMVGAAVRLHPVWMLFAVIAFGTLFGFVGALIAVPLAAVAGVIARHLVRRYRESALYKGGNVHPPT